jgi:hypothetical protein
MKSQTVSVGSGRTRLLINVNVNLSQPLDASCSSGWLDYRRAGVVGLVDRS